MDTYSYGRTSKLMIGQFIVRLFDEQVKNRYSDKKLVELIRKEFPQKSRVQYERYMNLYRNIYNRGEWPCQSGKIPAVSIAKYDDTRKPIMGKPGPQPRMDHFKEEG